MPNLHIIRPAHSKIRNTRRSPHFEATPRFADALRDFRLAKNNFDNALLENYETHDSFFNGISDAFIVLMRSLMRAYNTFKEEYDPIKCYDISFEEPMFR